LKVSGDGYICISFNVNYKIHDISYSYKLSTTANVLQGELTRQGRKVTEFEKKNDALSRKRYYESELKSTMLRLRGSFADVILGAKKELQTSIDKSFAIQSAEMEKGFTKRLLELEKTYTKKAIEAELSFAHQLKVKDTWLEKKTKEIEQKCRDSTNMEVARMHSQLNQSVEESTLLHAKLRESEQAMMMIQGQMSQEREGYRQALANVTKGRDDAVTKLSSTLETLQNTCAKAQEAEAKLIEAQQQVNIENERANILQGKLDNEVKNKNTLINVQKEMEKHLSLERERADLLQQELNSEARSKQEVASSLQQANQENTQLKNELESTLETSLQMRDNLDHTSQQLHISNDACSKLKTNLGSIQDKFQETVAALHTTKQEYSQLTSEFEENNDRLTKTTELNALLEAKVQQLGEKVEDQELDIEAARLSEADVESCLADTLQMNSKLQQQVEQLTEECNQKEEEYAVLEEVQNERDELKTKLEEQQAHCRELETEKDALEDYKAKVEEEHEQDRDKIASALLEFDVELTNAETKLNNVLELNTKLEAEKENIDKEMIVLKEKVKELTDANAKAQSDEDEDKRMKDEITVYEEAITMLKKQVVILQAIADEECNKCSRDRDEVREEIRKEFKDQINDQRFEHESMIMNKNADIASLREKVERSKKLTVKARKDLLKLRDEKSFLEGSLERSIQYIHDLKETQEIHASQQGVELVVKSPTTRLSTQDFAFTMNDVDEFCAPLIDKALALKSSSFKDIGSDLDHLLSRIENQLGVGCVVPPTSQQQLSNVNGDITTVRSW